MATPTRSRCALKRHELQTSGKSEGSVGSSRHSESSTCAPNLLPKQERINQKEVTEKNNNNNNTDPVKAWDLPLAGPKGNSFETPTATTKLNSTRSVSSDKQAQQQGQASSSFTSSLNNPFAFGSSSKPGGSPFLGAAQPPFNVINEIRRPTAAHVGGVASTSSSVSSANSGRQNTAILPKADQSSRTSLPVHAKNIGS